MGRKARFDPRLNETFGYSAEAENSEVYPSSSFSLDPFDDAKICQGE